MSETAGHGIGGRAARAFQMVMAAGLLLVLAANVPGQMTTDSVIALVEARTDVRQTWAPAISSWLLKPFDHWVAGTGLFVAASAALMFLSLMALPRLRPRSTWVAVVLAVLAVLTPQFLIYQGIVWRDVLFANLTLAGFVLLAAAAQRWASRPLLSVICAFALLAVATLVRQNGAILLVAAAGVLAWTARAGGWRASLTWGLGALVAAGLLAFGLNRLAQPAEPGTVRPAAARLILEHYDVVGAKAHHPKLKLKEIAKVDPAAAELIETEGMKAYSAARIDTLDTDEVLRKTLWHVPAAAMDAQWRRIILHYPAAYALQRLDVFRWTFLTPKLDQCLPVAVGVTGPDGMLKDLDIQAGVGPQAKGLMAYAAKFYGTPVYSHLTWAIVALGVMGLLLHRRDPADWVIIALLGGTLAFVASFAVISVACDYRYLYLLDLAAMAGVLYTALDPPRWRRPLAR
ncbi:MAG: hypothetical protein ACXWKM_10360 [Phenylobacterium sp.]